MTRVESTIAARLAKALPDTHVWIDTRGFEND
jgi:hypothetical protein